MRILLSNDDGYFAPGIECSARTLSAIADITVVAPERDRSGASNSLTLDRPLSLRQSANGFYYVNGTPTDCVHLAVTGMLDELPDMVVSESTTVPTWATIRSIQDERGGNGGIPRYSVGGRVALQQSRSKL